MTPKEFVDKLGSFAKQSAQKTGIDAAVILAQSALETGWGEHAPGNMMFGVKDFDGINGNEQLINTFEYHVLPNRTAKEIGLAEITSIKPVTINGKQFFKYTGPAYFRKYNTPEESFTDHCRIFFTVKRYEPAMAMKDNPEMFVRLMAPVYAQAPNYADVIIQMMKTIKKYL